MARAQQVMQALGDSAAGNAYGPREVERVSLEHAPALARHALAGQAFRDRLTSPEAVEVMARALHDTGQCADWSPHDWDAHTYETDRMHAALLAYATGARP